MHLLEDKAASLSQNLNLLLDVLGNCLWCSVGQQPLGVAASAPDGDVLAESRASNPTRPCLCS